MSNDSTPIGAASDIVEGLGSDRVPSSDRWRNRLSELVGRFLTRDIFNTISSSFVLFGLFTVQGVLLARMLGPEGRGQYATAMFYTQTLIFIGLFGTQHAVARWAARRRQDTVGLMQVCRRLGTTTGLATMAVVAGLALFALPADKQHLAPLCILCSLFLPLEHIRLLWLSVDHGLGNFSSYNANRLAAGIAFPALLTLAWLCNANSVVVVSLLFVMAPIVGLVYRRMTASVSGSPQPSGRGPTVKRILRRGRPYAVAVLASDLFDRIDIFLFLWLTSFAAQGCYAAAVPAANLLLVMPLAVSLFAFNAGAHRQGSLSLGRLVKAGSVILGVQLLAAVAFAVVLEPLMMLVFGESFRGAVPLAMALLPAYAIAGCGRVAESYLQGRNKAMVAVYSRLAGAATLFVFVFLFFDRWAELSIPLGALAGHLVSTTLLVATIIWDVREQSPPNGLAKNDAAAGGSP